MYFGTWRKDWCGWVAVLLQGFLNHSGILSTSKYSALSSKNISFSCVVMSWVYSAPFDFFFNSISFLSYIKGDLPVRLY